MKLKEIEQAIIERLKSQITDVPVEAFPEQPSEYRLRHASGVLLVVYRGAKYAESQSASLAVQARQQEWDVIVVSRNLRTHTSAYDLLDQVRTALSGYRVVPTAEVMVPVREAFINEVNGIWQYGITFAFSETFIAA